MNYTILVKYREPYVARVKGNSKLRASSTCSPLEAVEAVARKLAHKCGVPYTPSALSNTCPPRELGADSIYTYKV